MVQQETILDLKGILYHYSVRNIPICGVSVATMIHEYGHLICSKILEFNGYIKSEALTSVYPVSKPIGIHLTLFYLSGGLLQFLVFGLMSLQGNDRGIKIANRMTAVIGLIEAIVEPIQTLRLSGLGASIGIILAFIYLAYEIIRIDTIS
jgi:hypothetical protein